MRIHPSSILCAFAMYCTVAHPGDVVVAEESVLTEVTDFGANPGNLRMQVHIPDGLEPGAPLVVIAHGCFQTVETVSGHSGWVELSDRYQFALLFPQTSKENEPFGGCFRTWVDGHQKRGEGEPLSIKNQIEWLVDKYGLDRQRVYMAGQSSGGLETAVMLASYPEVFAAGGIQSAYPYRCANSFEALAPCSQALVSHSAEEWGELLRSAAPGYTGPRPRVTIWHGAEDKLLFPANLETQLQQWAQVLAVDTQAGQVDQIDGNERHRYANGEGEIVIETVLVSGMEHAIAIDPDGDPPCGSPAPYIVDANICAASWISRWFGIVPAED